MNSRKLLLQMLPGFIPLFIYIVAEEIWGTRIGLIVAVVIGLLELLYYLVKEKKFEKFVFFDTLFLVVLGVVSIIMDNDVFFKLKPAFVSLIACVLLGISAFTSKNIFLLMSKRYMKGVEFNEAMLAEMQKQLKIMFFIFVVYTALVFYSVWYMSDAGWAFVSGGLFYIIFGVYFVFEFIKNKIKRNQIKNKMNF